jgi:hypothetical protein
LEDAFFWRSTHGCFEGFPVGAPLKASISQPRILQHPTTNALIRYCLFRPFFGKHNFAHSAMIQSPCNVFSFFVLTCLGNSNKHALALAEFILTSTPRAIFKHSFDGVQQFV